MIPNVSFSFPFFFQNLILDVLFRDLIVKYVCGALGSFIVGKFM